MTSYNYYCYIVFIYMAATTSTADGKTSCEGPSAGADTGILKRGVGWGGSGIFFKMGGGGGTLDNLVLIEICKTSKKGGRINYASIILVCQRIQYNIVNNYTTRN